MHLVLEQAREHLVLALVRRAALEVLDPRRVVLARVRFASDPASVRVLDYWTATTLYLLLVAESDLLLEQGMAFRWDCPSLTEG